MVVWYYGIVVQETKAKTNTYVGAPHGGVNAAPPSASTSESSSGALVRYLSFDADTAI